MELKQKFKIWVYSQGGWSMIFYQLWCIIYLVMVVATCFSIIYFLGFKK